MKVPRLWIVWITSVLTATCAFAGATETNGPQLDGPARIDYCRTFSVSSTEHLQADFTNTSVPTLRAVRIRFDWYDAFGAEIGGISVDDNGTFTTGVRIRESGQTGGWTIGTLRVPWRANAAKVVCSIEKTLDVNGHVWMNHSLPSPAPSPAI